METPSVSAAVCELGNAGRTSRRVLHAASGLIAAAVCAGMCSSALAQSASWSGRATCGYLQQCDPQGEADGHSFASPTPAVSAAVGWVGLVPRALGFSQVDITTDASGNYNLYVRGYADVQSPSCPGGIASAEGKCDLDLTLTRVQKVQISYHVDRNSGNGVSSASMSGPAPFSVSITSANTLSASYYAILPAGTYNISGTVEINNSPTLADAFWSVRIIVIPCAGDFNGDGVIDTFDYLDFLDAFAAGDPSADINGDGVVDFADYLDFLDLFNAGC